MEYFVLKGHDTTGPFSEEDLRRAFAGQRLGVADLVRPTDERHWTPLRKLLDRLDGLDAPPAIRSAAPVAPAEPDLAAVLATMVPGREFPGLLATISANPLRAGLAGAVLAALLAFLSRWPLLVALPGLLLGVTAGLILIMRHRPLVGGAISLAAILLPIALAPKPSVPVPEGRELAAPMPVPAAADKVAMQPSVGAIEEITPPPDTPVEVSSRPRELPVEVPRGLEESPAPVPGAIPALPAFVEKPAPAPRGGPTPPPTLRNAPNPDRPPASNLAPPPVRPLPAPALPPLPPPNAAARPEPSGPSAASGPSQVPFSGPLPSIGLSVQATATGGKVTSRNGLNITDKVDGSHRLYGEDYWSTRDRESRVGIDIDVHNFSRFPATVTVQSLFFAKGVTGGSPVLLNSTAQDIALAAGGHENLNAHSATVTNSTDRTFSQGTSPDGYARSEWSAANVTGGAKVYGWIVQVMAGGKPLAMRASNPTLEQIARNPAELAKVTAEMPAGKRPR